MNYGSLLITGGAGFMGSNLACLFKEKYPRLKVYALDNLKRRGSELNICRLNKHGIEFIHADIRCQEDLVFKQRFELLIDCAAESSVLGGIDFPPYIINTNLQGTVNCLELARKNKADVIFISTNRVYSYPDILKIKTKESETRLEWVRGQKITGFSDEGIGENFSVNGSKTLYGATKLASEQLFHEYMANYKIRGVINRCSGIAGPWQFGKTEQGVFGYWVLAHYFKKELSYIGFGGKGKQVRDLLHVEDLFRLIDLEANLLEDISGRVYNVGGGKASVLSLLETTSICRKITGNRVTVRGDKENRPGDIPVYISDNSSVLRDTRWSPRKSPESILSDIYRWVRKNEAGLKSIVK
jgi:CDP-paratose 2-epimerase